MSAKRDIKRIHALFQALSTEEKEELYKLESPEKDKEKEEDDESDSDFWKGELPRRQYLLTSYLLPDV